MAQPVRNLQVATTTHGGPPLTLDFPIGATQTFKKGDPVQFGSAGNAGKVVIVTTVDVIDGQLLGIAAEDATSIASPGNDDRIKVIIAVPTTIFQGVLEAADTGVVASNGALAGMILEGGIYKIDLNKTAAGTKSVRICGLSPYGPRGGELGGGVLFSFLMARQALFNAA